MRLIIVLVVSGFVIAGAGAYYFLEIGIQGSTAANRIEGVWESKDRGTIQISSENGQTVGFLIIPTSDQIKGGYRGGEASILFTRDRGQGVFDVSLLHRITEGQVRRDEWVDTTARLSTNSLLTIGDMQFWR